MNKKTRPFPLPLSSVVNQKKTGRQSGAELVSNMMTPQTAMRNLAQSRLREEIRKPVTANPVSTVPMTTLSSPRNSHRPAKAMVERLVKQGVQDKFVLNAMEEVPRHLFIESGLSSQAYADASLPIGHQQTISRPYTVARMIEVMRNRSDGQLMKRVLEIGTGCGYQAAVLAQVAHEVYSIERIKALHELARKNLRPMRIPNLRLHYGDGMLGLPQVSPFDGIVLAAAGMEVPKALFMQLAIGGRMIAPVGNEKQLLQLTERVSEHKWKTTALEDCHFVPLREGIV